MAQMVLMVLMVQLGILVHRQVLHLLPRGKMETLRIIQVQKKFITKIVEVGVKNLI
tara:strand:+ start:279 stop:446 length:168 start_codon:yes stop_codon:yes gene_type:complete